MACGNESTCPVCDGTGWLLDVFCPLCDGDPLYCTYGSRDESEGLRAALGSACPGFLTPLELARGGGVASFALEEVRLGCKLLTLDINLSEVDGCAVQTSAVRQLHRARLVQSLRYTKSAVCICQVGRQRMHTLVQDGCVFKTRGSLPTLWEPISTSLEHPVKIRSMCLSPWVMLAIDDEGKVLIANNTDQPGESPCWTIYHRLAHIRAAFVSSRFGQIYVVTQEGELYAWGPASGDRTPTRACSIGLPTGAQDVPEPVKITGMPGVDRFGFGRAPVLSVACGAVHAVFICRNGEVFSVGQGHEGQLGNRGLGEASIPVRVALPEGVMIRAGACGLQHTLLVSTDGVAWGCGGTDRGQLPLRSLSPGALPPPMAAQGFISWAFEAVPRRLDLLLHSADLFVVSVACGLYTSFFLGDNGAVFLTGEVCNDTTPFGRSRGADPKVPYRLQFLPPISEMAVSLNVPLKLPGVPYAMLSPTEPKEVAMFRSADSTANVVIWGAPGGRALTGPYRHVA